MALTIHTDAVPLRPDADGTVRVGDTRVTLDVVVAHYRAGASAEEIAERFAVLTPADVHAVLAYYLRHREEVDRYLAERDREAEEALKGLGERHQPWPSVRNLLAGRSSRGTGDDAALPGG